MMKNRIRSLMIRKLQFRNRFLQILAVALPGLMIMASSCQDGGKVIETIGKETITTSEYEQYYSTYVDKAAIFSNAEKSTLYKLMCNPDQVPMNPILQDMLVRLDPRVNYEEFREMKIIEQVAKEEGFLDKPTVKNIIEQVVLETVVRLYVQDKLDERIKISQEDKQKKCEELRQKFPQRMASVPIDTCLFVAEGYLKQEIISMEEPRIRNEFKESISVKKNSDFDRKEYLTEKMDLYQTMKKKGGCAVASEPESSTEDPAAK